MSHEGRGDKPDPVDDVRKGLGLLFRAARHAVGRIHEGKLEEVVVSGAKEVGRAFENVATTLEREIFGQGHQGTDIPKPPKPPQVSDEKPDAPPVTGEEAKPPQTSGEKTDGPPKP
jgi:hypothetical protein